MKIEMTELEFRRLLDMVYIGNWILNSHRGSARIRDYDKVQSKIFSYCMTHDMTSLVELGYGFFRPSMAFEQGGILDAVSDYEDSVFFEILAEEMARRDMASEPHSPENEKELSRRIDEYIREFAKNGIDNISLNKKGGAE